MRRSGRDCRTRASASMCSLTCRTCIQPDRVFTPLSSSAQPEIAQVTLARWRKLKAAASQAILANGGTISHQHGVGIDHAAYLVNEKGVLGISAFRALLTVFDPTGMMNPGKLL